MIVKKPDAERRLSKGKKYPIKLKGRKSDYYVLSESGKKNLGGPYSSMAKAKERIRQVEYFKRVKGNPSKPKDTKLYEKVKAEAKKNFDVWPSIPASSWVVAEYKKRGGAYEGKKPGKGGGLEKWYDEEWVDISRSIDAKGRVKKWVQCARPDQGKRAYPKCVPLAKAKSMTPKQRLSAIRRKRKAERKTGEKKGRRPKMVSTLTGNPRKTLYIYPNKSSVAAAKRGLKAREKAPKSKKGGLDAMQAKEAGVGSGVLRARDIVSGKRINAYQVKAFFDRHQGNYLNAVTKGMKPEESKAIQAWLLWGGDPLYRQVKRAVEKDKRDENPKEAFMEVISGGASSGMMPSDFDPVQLKRGTMVEMEHTHDPRIAQEIAMDHLAEHPEYYTALEEMESRLEKNPFEIFGKETAEKMVGGRLRGDRYKVYVVETGTDEPGYWGPYDAGSIDASNRLKLNRQTSEFPIAVEEIKSSDSIGMLADTYVTERSKFDIQFLLDLIDVATDERARELGVDCPKSMERCLNILTEMGGRYLSGDEEQIDLFENPCSNEPLHPNKYPKISTPITKGQFAEEFTALLKEAGIEPGDVMVAYPESLSRTHRCDARRYAQVYPYSMHFEFAEEVLCLPRKYRQGLLAHEIGHVLDPEGGEDDADRASLQRLGIRIGYDHQWPGKGLQYAIFESPLENPTYWYVIHKDHGVLGGPYKTKRLAVDEFQVEGPLKKTRAGLYRSANDLIVSTYREAMLEGFGWAFK